MRSSSIIAALAMVSGLAQPFAPSAVDQRFYPIPMRYAKSRPGSRTQPQAGDKLARKAAKGKIGLRG